MFNFTWFDSTIAILMLLIVICGIATVGKHQIEMEEKNQLKKDRIEAEIRKNRAKAKKIEMSKYILKEEISKNNIDDCNCHDKDRVIKN